MLRRGLLLVLLLLLVASAAAEERRVLLDTIAATVHNDIITMEEIRVQTEILGRTGLWFTQLDSPNPVTAKMVFDEILARRLLFHAAMKMGFSEVAEADIEGETEAFRSTFANLDEYRDWLREYEYRDDDFPADGIPGYKAFRPIRQEFYRRLAIEQYLSRKIGIQIKIALTDYFEDNKEKLQAAHPDVPPERLPELARRQLYLEKLQTHLQELRAQTTVLILRDEFR